MEILIYYVYTIATQFSHPLRVSALLFVVGLFTVKIVLEDHYIRGIHRAMAEFQAACREHSEVCDRIMKAWSEK